MYVCVLKSDDDWKYADAVLQLLQQMVFISFPLPLSLLFSICFSSFAFFSSLWHDSIPWSFDLRHFCLCCSLLFSLVLVFFYIHAKKRREWRDRTVGLSFPLCVCVLSLSSYRFFFLILRSWLIRQENKKRKRKTINDSAARSIFFFFSRSCSFSLQGDLGLAMAAIKWTTHYDIFFLYVSMKSEIFSIVIKSRVLSLSVCTYNPDKRHQTKWVILHRRREETMDWWWEYFYLAVMSRWQLSGFDYLEILFKISVYVFVPKSSNGVEYSLDIKSVNSIEKNFEWCSERINSL